MLNQFDELMTIQIADHSVDYQSILPRNELPQSRSPNGS